MTAQTLRVGIVSPAQSFDPYRAMDYIGGVVAGQIFQSPFAFARGDEPLHPLAFAGPLESQGRTRLVGRIREGLRFSDGSKVEASDVVSSLQQVWSRGRELRIREDQGTVVFERAHGLEDLQATLVTSWSAISKRGEGKIGSGAYVVAPESTPELVRLVRNPHYGGEQGGASIPVVELRCYPPQSGTKVSPLVKALETGEVDFTQVLSRDEAARLSRVRKLYQPGSSTAILYLNSERIDLDTRQAIVASIDRYRLTSLCYDNPAGFVARGLLPPRMGSYADEVTQAPMPAERFAKLGRMRMLVVWASRPYLARPMKVAEELVAQLAKVGLEVELLVTKSADDYFERLTKGDYDAVLTGWIADSGDPREFLHSVLHSRSILDVSASNPSATNLARWSDARTDELIAKIGEGLGRHSEQTATLLRHIGQQAPLLPLMYGPSVTVLSRRVRSFEPHPLNIYPVFAELEL